MKWAIAAIALATLLGVGIPVISSIGGGNEASRLVEAAGRTQEKADSVGRSYNDVIPPPVNPRNAEDPGGGDIASEGKEGEEEQPTPTPAPTLTPGEHAVRDAMELLAKMEAEFGPQHTEYTQAVDQLKRAWEPRYNRAVDEFHRFEDRVEHARDMCYDYLEIQQRLTANISSREMRRTHEERDTLEQLVILDWMNQADNVLAEARAIKIKLDDMNISITKLELSATFAAVYEGFHQMPLAITLLNGELEKFQQESELIYQTFGPKTDG